MKMFPTALLAAVAASFVGPAALAADLTRPISSFTLTLMPPGKGEKPFGWIELLDPSGKPSGYIYLEDGDEDPHLGGGDTYIVTHLPYHELAGMLTILKEIRPLQIRFASGGAKPSVFIESATAAASPEVGSAANRRKAM